MTRRERAERLVEKHQGLAAAMVVKLRVPGYLRAECHAAAWLALYEAALRFRPAYGAQFPTYAFYRVKGAIYNVMRHNHHEDRGKTETHARAAYSPRISLDDQTDLELVLAKLDPLDRALLEAHFVEGWKQNELRGTLSKSWTSRRVARALARAREIAR